MIRVAAYDHVVTRATSFRPGILFLIGSLALGSSSLAQSIEQIQAKVKAAVAALGSDDPAQRESASKQLIELGPEARTAVFEATRSDNPELKAKAAEVLLKLPWYLPDDSPAVRQLLSNYGQLDIERRREIVTALADLPQHGYEALARLIQEEPSNDVKWNIAGAIRLCYLSHAQKAFQQVDTDSDCAPLLAAAGHAWLSRDVDRGVKLLRKAIDLELDHPSSDSGELDYVFDRVANLALLAGKPADVAALLRKKSARTSPEEGDVPYAVIDLFAAHAKWGPLPGFEKDLQTFQQYLGDPRIGFALGKVYEKAGQRLLASATYRAAFAADMTNVQSRFDAATFLYRQNWPDLAEAQLKSIYDLAPDHSAERGYSPEFDQANSQFRLSQIAVLRDDQAAAASHLRQAMKIHYKSNGELRGTTDQAIWQEIVWHELRAADRMGDRDAVNKSLEDLLKTVPANPDIANDVVPILRKLGRTSEAGVYFEKVAAKLQEDVTERPEHPMPKNNLAWLCVRCGERKEEALKLAVEATTAMPDNAAFLDTLAEAHFALGNAEKAAELEAKVVSARPNDKFLQAQFKRFRAPKQSGQ